MDRFGRRLQVEVPQDNGGSRDGNGGAFENPMEAQNEGMQGDEPKIADEEPGQFAGLKMRRKAALAGNCKGDYVGVSSDPFLDKILRKQGDRTVLFADKVIKVTGSGKMKKQIMLITDFAMYLVDSDADALKRRIALAAVEKICSSKFSDNFFALIIPTEYDCLMASTRKTEIVNVLVEATKGTTEELEVIFSNREVIGRLSFFSRWIEPLDLPPLHLRKFRFEYNAADDIVKEVEFVEAEDYLQVHLQCFAAGAIRTRISRKVVQ